MCGHIYLLYLPRSYPHTSCLKDIIVLAVIKGHNLLATPPCMSLCVMQDEGKNWRLTCERNQKKYVIWEFMNEMLLKSTWFQGQNLGFKLLLVQTQLKIVVCASASFRFKVLIFCCMFLQDAGFLWLWGANHSRQLGLDNVDFSSKPYLLSSATDLR